ncbi:MAG: hypothetical protein PVI92_10285 [Chromatiales bacterium]|jgi:hypothetical protein
MVVLNNKDLGLHLVGLWAFGLASTVQAQLIDRDNGMIYESEQNLTWLQDANYARTSGYDLDGKMTWQQAMAWVEGMVFNGFDEGRPDRSGGCSTAMLRKRRSASIRQFASCAGVILSA